MATTTRRISSGTPKVRPFSSPVLAAVSVRVIVAAWFGLVLLLLSTFSFPAAADTVADERQFVELINDLRVSEGLQPLLTDNELRVASRSWSQQMANNDSLEHANDISSGVSSNWSILGENVGVTSGQNVRLLFDRFVASPDHYRNLVDPEFTHVGVGVVYDAQGKLWTTHRFMATDGVTSPAATPPEVTAPATAPPTKPPAPTSPPATGSPVAIPPAAPPETAAPAKPAASTPATDDPVVDDPVAGAPVPTPSTNPPPQPTPQPSTAPADSATPTPSTALDGTLLADVMSELQNT